MNGSNCFNLSFGFLVSGLLSNAALWEHQVKHLSNVQIVSPARDSAEKMVQEILDVAPSRFALAGHSMGGWLALELMHNYPERVTKLCLLNTTSRDDPPEKKECREQWIARAQKGEFVQLVDEIIPFFVFDPTHYDRIKQMFLEVGPESFIAQEMAMLHRASKKVPDIHCPTLVIHSIQDQIFSLEESQELVQTISGAQLELIEHCGHMSPLEQPDKVTALLQSFFSQQY